MTTIVVLALACAGFGVVSALQGPKLQGARVDAAAAVTAPATLRLVLDEAVKTITAKQISVTPKTKVTLSTDGNVVLLRFAAPLDYATPYAVTLKDVRAAGGGAASTLVHRFRTPDFAADWVERTPKGDRIMRGQPGRNPVDLFDGSRIQDFLTLPSALFVASLSDDNHSTAQIVATDSLNKEDVTLPGEGQIGLLEYVGSSVLYTFTSAVADPIPEFDDTLFTLDLSGDHLSTPVLGLDGKPIAVDGMQVIPGSTSVFLHARSGGLLRWDVTSKVPPTLVGNYIEMGTLASDGYRISATDAFGSLILNTKTSTEERANPSPIDAVVPFIADVVPMSGGRRLELAARPSADFTSFDVVIALDDGTRATVLYRPTGTGNIVNYRLTQNERYVVAEVSLAGAGTADDGYGQGARPLDVVTVVIDVESGKVVAQWTGSHARW